MDINRKSRRQLRLQNASFVVLFLAVIGLVAWLSTRYDYQADWTASGRHTLSEASVELLRSMEGAIHVTAFARDSELAPTRRRVRDLVGRYQRVEPDLQLDFIDPDQRPDLVRELGVSQEGELVVEYRGRRENVRNPNEQALTNALQRLARGGERRVLFLAGHGERNPQGAANHDYSEWTGQLEKLGFVVDRLTLTTEPRIPDDTALLVVADPRTEMLAGEVALIQGYVASGGNLLWLTEPGEAPALEAVGGAFGVTPAPGTIVDLTGRLLGIEHPAFVVVADYPRHPVTEELTSVTLFPFARPLAVETIEAWQTTPLLRTLDRSWSETGAMEGAIRLDGDDVGGPLTFGVAASRDITPDLAAPPELDAEPQTRTQRVVVVGDADFLSSQYLGNGANLELGNRLVNWLSHDDVFITIPPRTAPDTQLELTPAVSVVIGLGFLLVIPGGLVAVGVAIWLRRRKR